MKFLVAIALLAFIAFAQVSATGAPPVCDANNCCCYASGCTWYQCSLFNQGMLYCMHQLPPPSGCEMNAPDQNMEIRKVSAARQTMLLDPVAPVTGVKTSSTYCTINCEWFQRAVLASNPSKPCVFTGTRRESQCTVENVCTGCQSMLNFNKHVMYANETDVFNARCPDLTTDMDSISDKMFNLALEKCSTVAGCNCVAGPLNKDTILVKTN